METSEWKQEISARLQAHRTRRGLSDSQDSPAALEEVPRTGRKAKIAQQVLERYARATSYAKYLEDMTATPAETTPQQAGVEAVAMELPLLSPLPAEPVEVAEPWLNLPAPVPVSIALSDELPVAQHSAQMNTNLTIIEEAAPEDLLEASTREPGFAIPANLIEFPRLLVSARRARPRLAEGPLREPAGTEQDASQLAIFEVEPGEISTEPLAAATVESPTWHDIRLDTAAQPQVEKHPAMSPAATPVRLPVAPMKRRAMAALVDLSLISLGYSAFAAAFAAVSPALPSGRAGVLSAAAAFAVCLAAYYWMFANYASATPGMRYARIALCTFRDDNPTRSETRRRLIAFLMSLGTLGLGILWGLLDDDHLGWHDRISRTYQRAY